MSYTKDQCLQWIKTPHINPKTQKIIQKEKATFLTLVKTCKDLLSYDEVSEGNPEVLKWLYPNGNPTPVPLSPIAIAPLTPIEVTKQEPIEVTKQEPADPGMDEVVSKVYPNWGIYSGQVIHTGSGPIPHGSGFLEMTNHPQYYSYNGDFNYGKFEGKGNLKYHTGTIYSGQMVNNEPEGQGKFTKLTGEVYEGQFSNGMPHGEGILTTPDGTSKPIIYNKGIIVVEKTNKKMLLKEKLKAKSPQQLVPAPGPAPAPAPAPELIKAPQEEAEDDDKMPELEPLPKLIAHKIESKGDTDFPAKIHYSLQEMTDANKLKLANQSSQKLITEAEFAKLVSSDAFMSQLLQGERKLLTYKKVQYNKLIKQIQTALDDPLLKANQETDPIAKLMGKEDEAVKDLNKKLESLKTNLDIIDSRITELGDDLVFAPKQITDKRQKINKILTDPENGINTLLGDTREDIRRTFLAKIVTFGKAPELYINRFNNYNIMGPAGSGKTKLAGILGNFFYNLGILNTSKVVYVTRADLVAGYIGQTAPLTRQYLSSTLEGVLFIDEAYQLSGCPDKKGEFSNKDFGTESITEIVNYVDKHIGLSVIIGAGYEEQMNKCFLKINEGMRRRFPNNLRLINYNAHDLSTILYSQIKKMFDKQILTPSQVAYIDFVIESLNTMKSKDPNTKGLFSNQAGDMLNLSNTLIQDLVLNQKKGYQIENINNSFTRFFISKGLQVIIKI